MAYENFNLEIVGKGIIAKEKAITAYYEELRKIRDKQPKKWEKEWRERSAFMGSKFGI